MQENELKEIKQIIKELPNLLNKFCFEYEEFNKEYSEDIFEEPKINNTKGFSKKKIELWKEETKFDKIQETLERNKLIIKTESMIREIINKLTSKFDSFKKDIYDKKQLKNGDNFERSYLHFKFYLFINLFLRGIDKQGRAVLTRHRNAVQNQHDLFGIGGINDQLPLQLTAYKIRALCCKGDLVSVNSSDS